MGNRLKSLDNSSNADIQHALSLHCVITVYLEEDDEQKFGMRTLLTTVSGIRSLRGEGGNVPSTKRTMEDCDQTLRTFGMVYEHGGKMVFGLANRNGHHNHVAGRNSDSWSGLRMKNVLVEEVNR